MTDSLLITNARMVNEGEVTEGDLLVRDGRIERLGGAIDAEAAKVIDAAGRLLMPGMIDDQVHFREPGLTHKGDLATESRAAIAGGITSFFEMPNTSPPAVDAASVEFKYGLAAGRASANYAFYLGATNTNADEVRRIDPNAVAGVKIFMGASTGDMLVDNPKALEALFEGARTVVTTHCEDTPTIQAATKAAVERWGADIPPEAHIEIRSREACLKSSTLAVGLAKRYGTKLHVLHLTTADELDLFEPGPIEDKQITLEVCAHHLYFSRPDYATAGNRIKCNPAIKEESDRAALLAALAEDRIDIIATDHAPHLPAEKDGPYMQAAAGLPLVQDVLPSLFRHVHEGHFDMTRLVEKVCHNPARRFDVVDRGFLREGYWADLVLIDPEARYTVDDARVLSRCGWSPFAGREMTARVDLTVVSGVVAYADGEVVTTGAGRRLDFDRDV
ncbi:MAG: dihydroorotase [Pseudomonadota bacterium]